MSYCRNLESVTGADCNVDEVEIFHEDITKAGTTKNEEDNNNQTIISVYVHFLDENNNVIPVKEILQILEENEKALAPLYAEFNVLKVQVTINLVRMCL